MWVFDNCSEWVCFWYFCKQFLVCAERFIARGSGKSLLARRILFWLVEMSQYQSLSRHLVQCHTSSMASRNAILCLFFVLFCTILVSSRNINKRKPTDGVHPTAESAGAPVNDHRRGKRSIKTNVLLSNCDFWMKLTKLTLSLTFC